MRLLLLYILLFLSLTANAIDERFKLNVSFEYPTTGTAFLKYVNKNGKYIQDSCSFSGQSLSFEGSVNEYCRDPHLSIKVRNAITGIEETKKIRISLENTLIQIQFLGRDLNTFRITGNITDKKLEKFDASLTGISNTKKDSLFIKNKVTAYCMHFKDDNSSPCILYDYSDYFTIEELIALFKKLSARQQASYSGNYIRFIIDDFKRSKAQVGLMLDNINMTDANGTSFNLHDYSRKGLLILDFWASWCGPCRADSRELKKLYSQFNPFGLNIIGISVDEDAEKWRNAIVSDSLYIWPQVILQSLQTKEGTSNNFNTITPDSFPTYFLLDSSNTILFRLDSYKDLEMVINEDYKSKRMIK